MSYEEKKPFEQAERELLKAVDSCSEEWLKNTLAGVVKEELRHASLIPEPVPKDIQAKYVQAAQDLQWLADRGYRDEAAKALNGLRESMMRVERLKGGDLSFGCAGLHGGYGSPECPSTMHHHHDPFCQPPTSRELRMAGIGPLEFKAKSRR